jgi:hypothetical protein
LFVHFDIATEARPLTIALLGEWIQQILSKKFKQNHAVNHHYHTNMIEQIRNSMLQHFHEESRELLLHMIPGIEMILPSTLTSHGAHSHPTKHNNADPHQMLHNISLTRSLDSREALKHVLSKFISVMAQAVYLPL